MLASSVWWEIHVLGAALRLCEAARFVRNVSSWSSPARFTGIRIYQRK